jgi:hypothetical protein
MTIMPIQLRQVLYTAEAVVEGGRGGHGRTSDGRLDVQLSVPTEMSGDGGPGAVIRIERGDTAASVSPGLVTCGPGRLSQRRV